VSEIGQYKPTCAEQQHMFRGLTNGPH